MTRECFWFISDLRRSELGQAVPLNEIAVGLSREPTLRSQTAVALAMLVGDWMIGCTCRDCIAEIAKRRRESTISADSHFSSSSSGLISLLGRFGDHGLLFKFDLDLSYRDEMPLTGDYPADCCIVFEYLEFDIRDPAKHFPV